MIFRCTGKLARRQGFKSLDAAALAENPLIDWSADLFEFDRQPYVFLMNTASLYGFVIPAKGMPPGDEFAPWATIAIFRLMYAHGTGAIYDQHIGKHTSTMQFAKGLNRSKTGSMNELMRDATSYMADGRPLELVNETLHNTLMGPAPYFFPAERLLELAAEQAKKHA